MPASSALGKRSARGLPAIGNFSGSSHCSHTRLAYRMWNEPPPQSLTWKPIGRELSNRPRTTSASDSGEVRSTDASACSGDDEIMLPKVHVVLGRFAPRQSGTPQRRPASAGVANTQV